MEWKPVIGAAVVALAVTACAPNTPSRESTPTANTPTANAPTPSDSASSAGQPTGGALPPQAAKVTITGQGQPITFEPTAVYCKGKPGALHHLIAKTNNQPPLLEVTPGQFAMVKLDRRGAPHKTTNLSGITIDDDGVTFTKASIGQVVVDGKLRCSKFEN